jgi:hypothetical protein
MKWLLVLVILAACGNSEGESKEKAKDLADKLKTTGEEVGDKATTLGGDVADKAKGLGGSVVDKTAGVASDVAGKASELSKDALALGRKVKTELDKVYDTTSDYDLTVDAVEESAANHDARLAAMPSVKIGTTAIGYEQDSAHTLLGVKYRRHFRATWRALDGRTVRLSFYTKEELSIPAFLKLLEKIVPVAIKVI